MRLGIMQPYFFPYIGYISLIKHTDMFILLDTVQFIRHGWIERNRMLNPNDEWQYISVPLKKYHQKDQIQNVCINNHLKWKEKILAQLGHYKKAPYYNNVIDILHQVFDKEYDDIVTLNKVCLEKVCEYLKIPCEIRVFSKMNLNIEDVGNPDEWALNICKAIPLVTEYWNPPGGISFFDPTKFEKEDISLKFLKINLNSYPQRRGKRPFVADLSILDVMMFNSIKEIHHMLDDYELLCVKENHTL